MNKVIYAGWDIFTIFGNVPVIFFSLLGMKFRLGPCGMFLFVLRAICDKDVSI